MNMISGDQDFGWADHSVLAAINADSPIPFFQSAQEAWVEDIVLSIFFSKALDDEEYRLFMDVFNEWILSGQRGTFGNRTFRGIFVQLPEPQVYRVSVAVGRRIDIVGALLTLARSLSDTPAIEVTRIVVGDDSSYFGDYARKTWQLLHNECLLVRGSTQVNFPVISSQIPTLSLSAGVWDNSPQNV